MGRLDAKQWANVQNDLPLLLSYMGTAVSGLRSDESLGHQNHIYQLFLTWFLKLWNAWLTMYFFFQVIPELFNSGQHWLKFFIFSEFKLVNIFISKVSDPERD